MVKNFAGKVKLFVLFLLMIFPSVKVFSQVTADPQDKFYIVAEGWELRGVIPRLPSLRPYPLNVIKEILALAYENGTEQDKEMSEFYSQKIFGKPIHFILDTIATAKLVVGEEKTGLKMDILPSIQGDFSFKDDLFSLGYILGGYFTTNDAKENFLPIYENFAYDTIRDGLSFYSLGAYLNSNAAFAMGGKNIYMQTGVYRTGFGPYFNEGISLNESSYHSANISFHLNQPKWSYSQQLSALGAMNSVGGVAPNKFISFHAVDFYLFPKLLFTYYESFVFGSDFNISYLIPAPFMVLQGISGRNNNLQMGFAITYKFFPGIEWVTDCMIDNIDANELVKFNFDTCNEIVLKTGFVYTPLDSICKRLSLTYTAISPFTYTHIPVDNGYFDENTYNYQDYSNNGICMGSSYPPNSNRIYFSMDLNQGRHFNLSITSAFMSHSNVSESLTENEAALYMLSSKGCYPTDGSLNNHNHLPDVPHDGYEINNTFKRYIFMNQDHKMFTVQGGIEGDFGTTRYKWGKMSVKASYLFEYISNKGVDVNIYNGQPYEVIKNGTSENYKWKGTVYSTYSDLFNAAIEAAKLDKANWVKNLHQVVDNYFSIGFVFEF